MSVVVRIEGRLAGVSIGQRVSYKAITEPSNWNGILKWYVPNNDGSSMVVSPDGRSMTITWTDFTSRDPSTGRPVGEISLYAYPPGAGVGTDCLTHDVQYVVPTVLVDLTVVEGASLSDGDRRSWVAVKSAEGDVIIEATTQPNDEPTWKRIAWSGDGLPVKGKRNQRKVPKNKAQMFSVIASLGGASFQVSVWILWCDLVIQIKPNQTIAKGNNAGFLDPNHTWPSHLGGGNQLGPWSATDEAMTDARYSDVGYKFAFGKMQAKATLQPPGVEDVLRDPIFGYSGLFEIKRMMTSRLYENGSLEDREDDADDTSDKEFVDLDPGSGSSQREMYDLDAPACPGVTYETIDVRRRTSEAYYNFTQYVTVILDDDKEKCSDDKKWSYAGQIDFDKQKKKVEKNTLSLGHIALPETSKYDERPL